MRPSNVSCPLLGAQLLREVSGPVGIIESPTRKFSPWALTGDAHPHLALPAHGRDCGSHLPEAQGGLGTEPLMAPQCLSSREEALIL